MRRILFQALLCALVLAQYPTAAAQPELLSVAKLGGDGKHNAFTDLIRFNNTFFCVFRESDAHIGGNGQIRVLTSADGTEWKSAALITEKGVDLRDPKLSETPNGELMLTLGGSVYDGAKLIGRQSRVAFAKDGTTWTPPQKVLTEGDWLWRVTWQNGTAYGVAYRTDKTDRLASLYSSKDGKEFQKITDLKVAGEPNEATVRFTSEGIMLMLIRREGGTKNAWIGQAAAPFTDWQWKETTHRVGGPNFILLDDGSIWAGGREYPGAPVMVLARMTLESYDPVLTLPSKGDNSYPGFVWHDGMLWISYYSSHEGKSSIYLAKVRFK